MKCPVPFCKKPVETKSGIACYAHWAMVPRHRKRKVFQAPPEAKAAAIKEALSVIPDFTV